MSEQNHTPSAPDGAQPRAASYHRAHRVLSVAGYVVDASLLVALLFTGWSAGLRDVA